MRRFVPCGASPAPDPGLAQSGRCRLCGPCTLRARFTPYDNVMQFWLLLSVLIQRFDATTAPDALLC